MAGEGEGATRVRLLDAAVAVIADGGWGAATSRVVAERAGVNNALVHYHFGSVDALRRAAVEHALERELTGPVAAALEAPDVLDGVVAVVAGLAAEGTESPGQRVLVEAMVRCLRDDALRTDMAQQLGMFRDVLTARLAGLRKDGALRADADPGALAVILTALIDGLLLHLMADPGLDIRAAAASLVALLRSDRATETRTP